MDKADFWWDEEKGCYKLVFYTSGAEDIACAVTRFSVRRDDPDPVIPFNLLSDYGSGLLEQNAAGEFVVVAGEKKKKLVAAFGGDHGPAP